MMAVMSLYKKVFHNHRGMRHSLKETDTLARAYLLMQKMRRSELPVLHGEKLVGVMSLRSIQNIIQKQQSDLGHGMESEKSVKSHMLWPALRMESAADLLSLMDHLLVEQGEAVVLTERENFLRAVTREDLLSLFRLFLRVAKERPGEATKILGEMANKLSALDFIGQMSVE